MRYIIGIDLGTTNSAVAFVDTTKAHAPVEMFAIPQLVGMGRLEARPTLPSFCYLSAQGEWPDGTKSFVGEWAKLQGARVPTKLVQSAKSWLCNGAADRREKILPVEAADHAQKISPVEASAKYLIHLRDAWNETMAKGDLSAIFEEQEIVLTVPASFDEVARTLTVEAARQAGLLQITLLEEPQAAFYSWIAQHESTWQGKFNLKMAVGPSRKVQDSDLKDCALWQEPADVFSFKEGESILVCDVGGGTTDFSLIEIKSQDDRVAFQRMAVGDHLLLGGDNMDAALAHYIEDKLSQKVEGTQWMQLLAEARNAKEELLGNRTASYSISLQGTGSSVIKGSLSTTLNQQEVEKVLGNGFFGSYSLDDALHLKKRKGLRSMGLPYEDEPSITKHLAHFLQQASYFSANKRIDYILFNGGTLKPHLFQQAVIDSLSNWYAGNKPKQLSSASLDLAVARGAAYYGKAKRGQGVSIGGGLPRSYYLEVDVHEEGQLKRKALTLLARGSQEGLEYHPDHIFELRPNTPVAFHLLTSHVRLHDAPGEVISVKEEEMQKLTPITTILRFGKGKGESQNEQVVPVKLGIKLTAVGIIELWLESKTTSHKWNLEFQWRAASGQDHNLLAKLASTRDETYVSGYLNEAKEVIGLFYDGKIKASKVMEELETKLQQPRREWPLSVIRGLFDTLIQGASKRKGPVEQEARFWNLAGFLLRPGYGYPLDDFRIKELWKIILSDLKEPKSQEIALAQWICFRRIAGGLNKGQQSQIASELMNQLFDKKTGKFDLKRKSDLYPYFEKIRALAAMERIDLPLKTKLGDAIAVRIGQQEGDNADYWALARIGARHLLYGSVGLAVPRDIVERWIEKLLIHDPTRIDDMRFALLQLSRKTDQREVNVSEKIIEKIIVRYPELQNALANDDEITQDEREQIFGDQLPPGLILHLNA